MNYAALLHSHVLFWALALSLFFVGLVLHSKGKKKGLKIIHMVLRLIYVLLLFTGISMIVIQGFYYLAVIKGILAFWLIYAMEMILVRSSKGTLTSPQKRLYWTQFLIALTVVMLLGYGVL